MNFLGVAIDGGRYVRIDPERAAVGKAIRLQTLKAGQDSARLEFALFRGGRVISRRICVVSGLKGSGGKPGEIRLRVEGRSRFLWVVRVRLPDGAHREVKIRTGTIVRFLPILAVLALILGIRFIFFDGRTLERTDAQAVGPSPDTPDDTVRVDDAAKSSPPDSSPIPAAFEEFMVTVYFDAESAVLNAAALSRLQGMMDAVPESAHLIVEGHCAAFGTEKGRLRLSKRRARMVADYLIARLPGEVSVETEGFGGARPVSVDPHRQELNRRVEIAVTETKP